MGSIRSVQVGNVRLGGGAPVALQSMTNAPAHDAAGTTAQVLALAAAGCDMVRVSVPDLAAVETVREVRRSCPGVALVADVHFDHRVAVQVAPYVDKVRLNPGTVRGTRALREVVQALTDARVPVRIGANAGSLPAVLRSGPRPLAERLCDAVGDLVARFEDAGATDLVLSVKTSSVTDTIAAYRLAAERFPYPLHVGLTESGTVRTGAVRSAVALGALLSAGIGDTIRVSLAGDPLAEVRAGLEILRSLGLRAPGPRVVACPTCGRSHMDVAGVAGRVEAAVEALGRPVTVAVMGCEVNGPGEAMGADRAIVGTPTGAALYLAGKVTCRGDVDEIVGRLLGELEATGTAPAEPRSRT